MIRNFVSALLAEWAATAEGSGNSQTSLQSIQNFLSASCRLLRHSELHQIRWMIMKRAINHWWFEIVFSLRLVKHIGYTNWNRQFYNYNKSCLLSPRKIFLEKYCSLGRLWLNDYLDKLIVWKVFFYDYLQEEIPNFCYFHKLSPISLFYLSLESAKKNERLIT